MSGFFDLARNDGAFLGRRAFGVSAVIAFLATVLLAFGVPAFAHADTVVAHSLNDDGSSECYDSIDKAMNAGYKGKTIYMDADWNLDGELEIAEKSTLTLDMNGHQIISTASKSAVITVKGDATFTLTSSKSNSFDYTYYDKDGKSHEGQITSGGLVTSTKNRPYPAINVHYGAKATLDNVAVAGNYSTESCGGVNVAGYLEMKNGATITRNVGQDGGGIYVWGDGVTVKLDNASVSDNYASGQGGGIYSFSNGTTISLTNGASISNNTAGRGGGIYFWQTKFVVESGDKTGKIQGNASTETGDNRGGGGGICVEENTIGENEGRIEGVTISDNTAYRGGGVYLKQGWASLIDCTLKGNVAETDGGGIEDYGKNCTLNNCTVTGNYCNNAGKNYEGGGIFVGYWFDLNLTGTCVIQGNTRGKNGSADDLFLSANFGNTARAYVLGGVSSDSKVGVRTGITGDCRIGKNISTYTYGTYFIDLDGYYVSKGTDEGGDLWQRNGAKDFLAKVNGEGSTRYKQGATVTANGTSSDSSKAFWCWDTSATTGLSPTSSYITDENKYSAFISYSMPQNDTNLVAKYADRVTKPTVIVQKPVVGESLATAGSFLRTDSGTGGEKADATITWYEVSEDGSRTVATGKASYGKTYVAVVSVAQDQKQGIFFSSGISAKDVSIKNNDSDAEGNAAATASVDPVGTLCIESEPYEASLSRIEKVEAANISVNAGISKESLVETLPDTATVKLKSGGTVSVSVNKSEEGISWPNGLLEDGSVADSGDEKKTYTLYVPLDASSKAAVVKGDVLEVSVTVDASNSVASPKVEPASGTYTSANMKDLIRPVYATCVTSGATIKYAYADGDGWGEPNSYGDELSLECPESDTTSYRIKFWAEKTVDGETVKSSEEVVSYTLEDTQGKTVSVKCSDTALYGDDDTRWSSSFDVVGNLGESVSVVAPAQKNHVFDHWLVNGKEVSGSTLAIDEFSLDCADGIQAVYAPVISKLDVGVVAPEADKALAVGASYVRVGVGNDDAMTEVTKYFANDAKILWSPASDAGSASHDTSYVASLELATVSSDDGVKYVLSDKLQVYINGTAAEMLDGGAYISTDKDGNKSLCATFPNTGPYEYESMTQPSDVKLSFDEASNYASGAKLGWGLPDQVEVAYKCGEKAMLDIDWGDVEGFDAAAAGVQELTVTGKVSYPGSVDNEGAPETVSVRVRVAAPEDGSGDDPAPATSISSAKVTLSKASFAYNGKAQKPSVKSVTLDGKTLTSGTDYTASVASGKKVGTYKVTITGKGSYAGTATATYIITPKSVTGLKLKKAKKSFKATWTKYSTERTGVQVRYSKKSNMSGAKTVKVSGSNAKTKTVKKLKKKTKYYVQVRSYKVVNGKTYYSGWSAKKGVKTK